MRFSRLRLNGFKSFVDPTDLVIADGLTGVVGPNGCGKSNLLEALRWVMGENRPTAMRGGGMEDVIFAGAATRPARNFAEVSLHIDNGERLAPAAFNDSDNLEIVRRITRDAGSAYKVGVKDVRARGRADAVCRCVDRGAFACVGAARADFGADQRETKSAAADFGRSGGHFGPVPAPPRGRAEAERGRDQSDPR